MKNKKGQFTTPYTRKAILSYLQAISKLIKSSPTYRDLRNIPGPSASTIIRHFGKWAIALKAAGIRPKTNQLMKGERTYIRLNWKKMTDKQISETLGISEIAVKYYRMQFSLWKNKKGTSKQKHKADGMRLYGKNCEVCNIPLTELHHIIPKSPNIKDWSILCPTCHAVITRKIVVINSRKELKTKLTPFIKNLYKNVKFGFSGDGDNGTSST